MDASPLSGPPGPPPQAFVIPATGEMADMSMDEDMDSPNARPGPTTTLGPPSQSRVSRNPLPTTRYVTPYKICVLVLLEMWCRMGEDLGTAASDALLEFVNSRVVNSASSFGEPGFAELRRQVETLADEHGEIVARHFIETVFGIDELDGLFSFFDSVSTLLGPTDPNLGVRKVDGSSPLGIYVRQCRLDFNTMPFDRAAALFVAVETYRNDTGSVDHVEERMENLSVGIPLPGTPRRTLFSPAQTGDKSPAPSHSNRDLLGTTAEQDLHMWIQRQMASIESMSGHLLPSSSRRTLRQLLTQMTELDEYSCLIFADAVERGEYQLAVDSLRRFFDRTIAFQMAPPEGPDGTPDESEPPRPRYQYALLHLASVHASFGYAEEAISALLECQEIARENHDGDCLKFCRLWLQNLESRDARPETQKDSILSSLVDAAKKSNLTYLQALGDLTVAKRALEQGKSPGTFFAAYTRANAVINRPERSTDSTEDAKMLRSLRVPAQLLLMEAYRRFGFSSLAKMLDTSNESFEDSCDVATWSKVVARRAFDLIHSEGKWADAEVLVQQQMEKTKGRFHAQAELRAFWDAMVYERSLRRGEISSLPIMASQVASSVPAVISSANNANSEKDAQVPQLMADYFLSIDKVPEAFGLLCDILALPSTSGPTLVPYLLKLANLHMTRSSSPLTALPLILMSLALGSQFHVVPDQLEASLKLASILLHFEGLAQRSLQLCEKAMPSILTSGPLAAKGEAWLTQARCLIACAGDLEGESASEARLELFEAALDALDRAKQAFETFESIKDLQAALYYKARVLDALGRHEERNQAAALCTAAGESLLSNRARKM